MHHRLMFIAWLLLLTLVGSVGARDDQQTETKAALQALNDFIGDWKGSGAPETSPARDTWQEAVSWSWRFQGDKAWLTMKVQNGKHLKSGELRYFPDKKRYQFTAVDANNQKLVFQGEIKNDYLTLEHIDPSTKETRRLVMNSAGDGVRFIYRHAHKPAGRTVFTKDYQVAFNKEGENLAAVEKKVECPVSGGLGKIPVSYKGVTYYVCCSGCRDAFNENPEKYVKEFEAKKKKD
jgi:hypothetical protein